MAEQEDYSPMCPDCDEALIAFELDGVEIDRCLDCSGTWLDTGELAMLLELDGLESSGLTNALANAPKGDRRERRCPRCGKKLYIVTVGDEKPVELDRCPSGCGLWLDKGEMQDVIATFEKNEEGEESVVAKFFAEMFKFEL